MDWRPNYMYTNVFDSSLVVLNQICFQDYDKHPLLKTIQIAFDDDNTLFKLAKLLCFFNEHYEEFVERKLYKTF